VAKQGDGWLIREMGGSGQRSVAKKINECWVSKYRDPNRAMFA
jgi:hypothetical protein